MSSRLSRIVTSSNHNNLSNRRKSLQSVESSNINQKVNKVVASSKKKKEINYNISDIASNNKIKIQQPLASSNLNLYQLNVLLVTLKHP